MSKIDEMLKNEKVEWKKLGDVANCFAGGTPKTNVSSYYDGDIPWIRSGEINFNIIKSSERNITEEGLNKSSAKMIRPNSVVLAMTGATVGRSAVVEFYTSCNQSVAAIENDEKILNYKYLYYYISSNYEKIKRMGQGSLTSLNLSIIKNILIPIPSLKTQEKIVNYLDEFTDYSVKIKQELQKELNLRNKQYEYYRDKLLSEEYLNKLISNYDLYKYALKETTLGDLAQVNRGASPRPISNFITNSEDGVPWIKISDAGLNSKYINKTMQRITREGAKKSRLLKKGDFIISNSMSYGRPYILAIEGCIHDGWASISEYEENLNSDFLYHYLNSNKVQNYWLKKMNTSSVSNLNSDIIKSLPIPIIDKNLQAKIAEILDKFQALTQYVSGLLPEEIEEREKQYEYYREKLLTFDTERTRGGYQLLSKDYISLLTQAGDLVGVNVFELENKKLEEVCEILDSKRKPITKSKRIKGIYPYYGANGIQDYVNDFIFDGSFVLMGEDGSVIDKNNNPILHWVNNKKIWVNNHAHVLKNKDDFINLKYIYYSLSISDVSSIVKGTPPKINQANLRNIKMLIPPKAIQEYIVSILDKFEALSQSTTEGLRREIELREKQYEYYREKLLTFEK